MSSSMREDWIECELGEVCEINMGQSPPSSTYNSEKNGLPFFQGKAEFTDLHPIARKWCTKPTRIANEGDILLSVRAPVGSTNIANQECAIGRGLAAITYPYSNTVIWYYLKSIEQDLDRQGTGTTFRAVSGNVIKRQKFPLAPLPIQRAIVSKIEALFTDLDNGIASFKKAQEQLKIYRQAVLKKAFEGGFTNENFIEGELPLGWEWVKLGEVTEEVQKVKRNEKSDNDEFIYLDIGGINNSINKIVNHKNYLWKDAPSRAQQIVKVGDTLFSTVRTYLKNIAFVEKEIYENQVCSSGFSVIRAKKGKAIPKYLYYYSIFEDFIRPLNEMQKGSSYPAIRSEDVFNQFIHIPLSLQEQTQIVAEIERRLSVTDNLEFVIRNSIEKAEALRQSILKKAFEGKLLSQAEIEQCKQAADYEPASELLTRIERSRNEKIKAEKLAKEQEKKKSTTKKKFKK